MFINHRHHPGLSQEAHRALPFLSNTDLTTTKNQALGITRQPNPQALAFGSHFHTAVLEPRRYQRTDERGVKWAELKTLAAAVRRQRFCRDLLYRGQAEQTYTATHKATGLTVKVRPDLTITSPKTGRVVLVDFKTTSAPDYAHFCATIEQYDYDRQAALYSDVLDAARFVIIGVRKKAPFEVWQFEVTPAPGLIEQGRKKYERLLRACAEQPRRPAAPQAQAPPGTPGPGPFDASPTHDAPVTMITARRYSWGAGTASGGRCEKNSHRAFQSGFLAGPLSNPNRLLGQPAPTAPN